MSMDREDIEEAIEVLEDASAEMLMETGDENYYSEAINALRQALETEQKPVAWMHNFITNNVITHIPADIGRHPERWTPLYTAPPKKEWVGLTDDAVFELADTNLYDGGKNYGVLAFAKAIEQALKDKNT